MIRCKAIEEKSLFVSATGQILPCCYMGGKGLTPEKVDLNFDNIVESWSSDNPIPVCKAICDDGMSSFPINRSNIEKQLR